MEKTLNKEKVSNILFIDNDAEINATIQSMVEKQKDDQTDKLNFILAKDTKEALIQMSKQEINLVILEIVLPIVSGYYLISEIKKKYPNTPIIIYTKLKKPQDLAKMAASGANNIYLKELVNIEQLIEKIKNEETAESIDKTVINLNGQIKTLMDAEVSHIQKMMQCPKCHLMVPPDSHFCNNCGQRIIKKAKKKLMQTPAKQSDEEPKEIVKKDTE